MDIPIWPLVAFSGSAIVPIMPIEREQFESFHMFKISEIEQMVSFAEDTGKLQFLLMRQPTDYYKLDFLEPIFKRLRPPQFMGIPIYEYANYDTLSQYYREFTAIADSGFRDHVRKVSAVGHNKRAFDSLMTNLQGDYMMLRAISNTEFSEEFAQLFRSDFENAGKLLETIDILVLRPLRNPLKCMDAYPLETIRVGQSIGLDNAFNSGNRFPCELGRLLMKKMTCYPESLDACKQITANYDDQDVIKLLQAVNEGVSKNNPEAVEKNEKELSAALDNVWNNKALLRKITGIRFGVPLMLGAIGTVAGGLSGGYAGLLSGLGFNAADRLFEYRGDAFSEKMSKFLTPSYQAIIFDFKKKYSLDSK